MILALDPSLRATGWVLAQREGSRYVPVEWGCIRTAPAGRKVRMRQSDDDVQALAIIRAALANHLGGVTRALVELPPGGAKGARANRCMGLVVGLVVAMMAERGIHSAYYSPDDVRRALGTRRKPGLGIKEAAAIAVEARWPALQYIQATGAETEAVVDALAVLAAAEVLG